MGTTFSDGVNPPKAAEGSEKNYFYQKHCELRLTGTRNENEGRWQAPRKQADETIHLQGPSMKKEGCLSRQSLRPQDLVLRP